MINDPGCREQLGQALLYAICLGVEEDLIARLKYLHTYMGPDGSSNYSKCELFKDFAPYSFAFSLYQAKMLDEEDPETGIRKLDMHEDGHPMFEDTPFMNGGLIFHPGASGPDQSLSVELDPDTKPHWSVHT